MKKERHDHLGELLRKLENAKSEPSPKCSDGEHDFKTIMHSDGRDSYSWTFECEKCGEIVRKTFNRKGEDRKLWR